MTVCTETIINRNRHLLQIKGRHDFAISSKSLKGLELVSNFSNRDKKEIEMFDISCTNICSNFLLIQTKDSKETIKILIRNVQ